MPATTHLRSLQALELAIRSGSLKAAAEQLAITPAAMGQRIKALEQYLGYDLLVRGRSGIRATAELELALAHLSAGFRELDTVTRILDFQRVHEIHLAADPDWAELWLQPRLGDFKHANPSILFCVNGSGDVPARSGAPDCTIAFSSTSAATGTPLFRDYLLPVSSPENTRRIANQEESQNLEGFPLLHLDNYARDRQAIGWPDWVERHGYRQTAPERGMRYQRVAHALEAVYADAGLLICGLALVEPQLASNKLSLPFPTGLGAWTDFAYTIDFGPQAAQRSAVQKFAAWLQAEARQTKRWLGATLLENPAITGN